MSLSRAASETTPQGWGEPRAPEQKCHCGAMPGCLGTPRVEQKEEEAAQEHKVEMAKQREWAAVGVEIGNGASGAITFLFLSL